MTCIVCQQPDCVCHLRFKHWYGLRGNGKGAKVPHAQVMEYLVATGKGSIAAAIDHLTMQDGTRLARTIRAAVNANWPDLVAEMIRYRVWAMEFGQIEGEIRYE